MKIGGFLCSHFIIEREKNKQHFWCIILYYFKKDKNTIKMQINVCAVYGEGAVTDQRCQKWFEEFLGAIEIFAK